MSDSAQCPLCERHKEASDFCSLHESARRNLEAAYGTWNKGYGNLTKEEYYEKVENLDETGRAVKEVIQHLRDKGAVI